MTLHIVDVSKYQAERANPLNPYSAHLAGFGALNIALDLGRGDDVLPTWTASYASRARSLSMGICTYRWLDARLSGAASARRAYDRMVALGGPAGMAHAVDVEDNATEQIIRDYVITMTGLLGRPIALYTADWWWTRQGRNWPMANLTPYLWGAPNDGYLADYPGDGAEEWQAGFGGWQHFSILQYAVKPLPNTGDCSLSAVRDPAVWAALTGETGATMPARTYSSWVAAGRPVSGLARPAARLRDVLRRYGYTVYDIGNDDHLRHVPPEDHTPYSDTGWPIDPPLWWMTAIDVMPPPAGSGLPSLAALARQIHDDREAGHPGAGWVKYMNWEPGDGSCRHCSWQPSHNQTTSTDRGHIHISTLGTVIDYADADDYDPVARVRGVTGGRSDDEMIAIFYDGKGYGRGNGVISAGIETWPEMVELQRLIKAGVLSGSATIVTTTPELARAYGPVYTPTAETQPPNWTAVQEAIEELSERLAAGDNSVPADTATIAAAIEAAVQDDVAALNASMDRLADKLAAADNGLPVDRQIVIDALKQALREGTGIAAATG